MNKEISEQFHISDYTRVLNYIILFSCFLIGSFFSVISLYHGVQNYKALMGIGISIYILGIFLFFRTFKLNLEIHSDKIIEKVGRKIKKELEFDNFKGFELIQVQLVKMMVFVPKEDDQKRINIELLYKEEEKIVHLISKKLPYITMLEHYEEIDEILLNSEVGQTNEEKDKNLIKAKRWVEFLHLLAFISGLWAVFQ